MFCCVHLKNMVVSWESAVYRATSARNELQTQNSRERKDKKKILKRNFFFFIIYFFFSLKKENNKIVLGFVLFSHKLSLVFLHTPKKGGRKNIFVSFFFYIPLAPCVLVNCMWSTRQHTRQNHDDCYTLDAITTTFLLFQKKFLWWDVYHFFFSSTKPFPVYFLKIL